MANDHGNGPWSQFWWRRDSVKDKPLTQDDVGCYVRLSEVPDEEFVLRWVSIDGLSAMISRCNFGPTSDVLVHSRGDARPLDITEVIRPCGKLYVHTGPQAMAGLPIGCSGRPAYITLSDGARFLATIGDDGLPYIEEGVDAPGMPNTIVHTKWDLNGRWASGPRVRPDIATIDAEVLKRDYGE